MWIGICRSFSLDLRQIFVGLHHFEFECAMEAPCVVVNADPVL